VEDKERSSLIARLVSACIDRSWLILAVATMSVAALTAYVIGHFAMSTDTYALLSPKLPWRARETAFNVAFPQRGSISWW